LVNTLNANYRVGDIGDDYFDVIGELSVTAGDEGKPALTIECTFEAHFHGLKEDERDLAQQFAQVEARLFLWPYFREFTSNMTTKMGLPPLILPLVLRQTEGHIMPDSHASGKKSRRSRKAQGKSGAKPPT